MINLIAMPKTISSRTSAYILYLGGGLAAVVMAALLYVGVFYHRQASAQDYPVQGFDLSHHQGDIQWSKISPEKFQFVYLKATEGGDFKDSKFQENWLKARERGFHVGAYHFYRLCRDGQIQAQNFIETVPKKLDALPPVIDLEYDSNCINTYTKEQLLEEIKVMHDLLKKHYAKQPIFYVSKSFYHIVLLGSFKDTPLWIRDYQEKPQLKDQRDWMFWQHTNQGKIQGITKPVDLNVFSGSQRQWQYFIEQNKQAPKP
ncbi:MAG TPA: lysozyme [Acinetobacter ursingii]|nr:lysozyme [Acinetobacter ursingii]